MPIAQGDTAPDPAGDKPDWMDAVHWLGYQMTCRGETVADVARVTDRGTGTVQRWRSSWREAWGAHLFRVSNPAFPEAKLNRRAGHNQVRAKWRETREAAADEFGEASGIALLMVSEGTRAILEDEERMAKLSISDLDTLSRIAERFALTADVLSGFSRTAGAGQNRPGQPVVPKGTLDALASASTSGTVAGIFEQIDVVVTQFAVELGEDPEAIEAESRKV